MGSLPALCFSSDKSEAAIKTDKPISRVITIAVAPRERKPSGWPCTTAAAEEGGGAGWGVGEGSLLELLQPGSHASLLGTPAGILYDASRLSGKIASVLLLGLTYTYSNHRNGIKRREEEVWGAQGGAVMNIHKHGPVMIFWINGDERDWPTY